ncbi:hypothetical protein [Saccharopolyspora sp. ASAGF58]|uniref:hypothetical protein n=1 Tax=Saccharopolyspora sp. ASAGF58 TaxID=2719023 RepID=UPI0014401DF7|nr:hypothetical protein [Saccharopolyspora sp. ASAGF58]QIZ34185.1 hypothetical protein FDZ84_04845 [Saccharopolyspora sp. ASAGF58]
MPSQISSSFFSSGCSLFSDRVSFRRTSEILLTHLAIIPAASATTAGVPTPRVPPISAIQRGILVISAATHSATRSRTSSRTTPTSTPTISTTVLMVFAAPPAALICSACFVVAFL